MMDIPICPECGKLAEMAEDEIYCDECYTKFIDWLRALLGPDGLSEFAAQLQQDRKLGVGLERKLEPRGSL